MDTADKRRWALTLRLLSPMQIGAGTLGMIEKTELFIPGRVLWGALTNMLTRQLCHRPTGREFLAIGSALGKDGSRTGTLFPSTDGGKSVWRPRFSANDRVWINSHDLDPRLDGDMRRLLATSVASNSTDPTRMVTDDRSLHSTDMISDLFRGKDGKIHPVCFKGTVELPETLSVAGQDVRLDGSVITTALNAARLGGGRKRGWGQIEVIALETTDVTGDLHTEPLPNGKGTWLLTANCAVAAGHGNALGRAFLAVHRQYDNTNGKGYGRSHTSARLCWEIGTLLPV
mgnify:CR=1 FL=1